ncbi:MAG TPA: hypothetical protein VEW42_02150 [Candidatus Eisenbacteria bacterium]|nr:hypothetical protein [Candidatus Eisenbacteria bacterium]
MSQESENQPAPKAEPKRRGKSARNARRRASGEAQSWNEDHKGEGQHDRVGQHEEHTKLRKEHGGAGKVSKNKAKRRTAKHKGQKQWWRK